MSDVGISIAKANCTNEPAFCNGRSNLVALLFGIMKLNVMDVCLNFMRYIMQISFSDPFCRTISRHSAANPDPNQRCLFSEDPNNTNKICLKSNVDDGFWCPTKGWSKEPHSKKGVCNDNCEKENGKNMEIRI